MLGKPPAPQRIMVLGEGHEQALREKVRGSLDYDAHPAKVAYACPRCDNVIAFFGAGTVLSGVGMQCGVCGTMYQVA